MSTANNLRQLLILVLLLSILIGACSRTPEKVGVSSEVTDKGVRLRISSDKEIYQPGDTVFITVRVENLTETPIEYTLWNIGDPVIYVFLENTLYSSGHKLYEKDYQVKEINPLVTGDILQGKQSITRQVVWDQQIHTYPDPIQAPTGSYSIRCEFFSGPYSPDNEPTKLSASVENQIQKAWDIIKPEKAVEIARNLPEVASWYTEHSGSNLVKYEKGQYYLYFFSEWQKVTPDFAADGMTLEEIKQSYEPSNNVLMVNNNWEVHFFTKFGPIPNEMIVKIEPTIGKVLSFEAGK
jgi:hypothetical protein